MNHSLKLFFLIGLAGFIGKTNAQPLHEYFFSNNFTSTAGGPTLVENLTCSAGNGSFSTQTVNTTQGPCLVDNVFCFNKGGGLTYKNPSYITTQ